MYVDDIVITGNCNATITRIIGLISARFSLKDLEEISYFLGIKVYRTSKRMQLTKQKYATVLLRRLNMANAKPAVTPIASTQSLVLAGTKLENPIEYRTVVGSLQYLTFTRPDIAIVVNRLSQFMDCPTTDHWEAGKRVLHYLAGTFRHVIYFHASSPLTPHAYSDADWSGDKEDYSFTGAYTVYPGKNHISWSLRKQKRVARLIIDISRIHNSLINSFLSQMDYISCPILVSLRLMFPPFTVITLVLLIFVQFQCFTSV